MFDVIQGVHTPYNHPLLPQFPSFPEPREPSWCSNHGAVSHVVPFSLDYRSQYTFIGVHRRPCLTYEEWSNSTANCNRDSSIFICFVVFTQGFRNSWKRASGYINGTQMKMMMILSSVDSEVEGIHAYLLFLDWFLILVVGSVLLGKNKCDLNLYDQCTFAAKSGSSLLHKTGLHKTLLK